MPTDWERAASERGLAFSRDGKDASPLAPIAYIMLPASNGIEIVAERGSGDQTCIGTSCSRWAPATLLMNAMRICGSFFSA